jgi:hypothetical protein
VEEHPMTEGHPTVEDHPTADDHLETQVEVATATRTMKSDCVNT